MKKLDVEELGVCCGPALSVLPHVWVSDHYTVCYRAVHIHIGWLETPSYL